MWKLLLSTITPAIIIYAFKKKIKVPKEKIPTFEGMAQKMLLNIIGNEYSIIIK